MKLKHVAIGAFAVFLIGRCGSGPDIEESVQEPSGQSAVADPSAATKDARAERRRKREEKLQQSAPSPDRSSSASQRASTGTTLAVLALLPVKGRASLTDYDRDRFGPAWLDADRNGCDTRNDILGQYLHSITLEDNGCVVAAGGYDDPYTA